MLNYNKLSLGVRIMSDLRNSLQYFPFFYNEHILLESEKYIIIILMLLSIGLLK